MRAAIALYCFIAMLECAATMPKNTTLDPDPKARVLEALRESNGVVTDACKKAGVERPLFFQWLKEDSGFAEAVADTGEIAIDFAEASLFDQIRRKEAAATIFYLKTKGKRRGYVERQEITGAEGALVVPNPFSTLDDQTLLKLAAELVKANAEPGATEPA